MKCNDLIENLEAYNMYVFTINNAAKFILKSNKYTSLFLSKCKGIKRIERGHYALESANIYQIASGIIAPSYISIISAFRYYDAITQTPRIVYVVASKQHKEINFDGYVIKFIKFKRNLIFGYLNIHASTFVAEIEKAIVDSLYLNVDFNYIKEAYESESDHININKIVEYAFLMHSNALISRLGFLLESIGIKNKYTNKLLFHKSKRLIKFLGIESSSKRWMVIHA